jgi:hypothetical protein
MARKKVEPATGTEAEIQRKQNEALERLLASDETKTGADARAVANAVAEEVAGEAVKVFDQAAAGGTKLGPGFFGKTPESPASIIASCVNAAAEQESIAAASAIEVGKPSFGQTVTISLGEEMFGMKGSFSSYRTPAVSGTTPVLPGETIAQAGQRLATELLAMQASLRVVAKAAFLASYETAFTTA